MILQVLRGPRGRPKRQGWWDARQWTSVVDYCPESWRFIKLL